MKLLEMTERFFERGTARLRNNTKALIEGHIAPAVCASNVRQCGEPMWTLLCGTPIEAIPLVCRLFSPPAVQCNSLAVSALSDPCVSHSL